MSSENEISNESKGPHISSLGSPFISRVIMINFVHRQEILDGYLSEKLLGLFSLISPELWVDKVR